MELREIAAAVEKGKAKQVKTLVNQALEEGFEVQAILDDGLISAMGVVGEKFRTDQIFVPEMLVAARAMSAGVSILEPLMKQTGVKPIGTVVIGTVNTFAAVRNLKIFFAYCLCRTLTGTKTALCTAAVSLWNQTNSTGFLIGTISGNLRSGKFG